MSTSIKPFSISLSEEYKDKIEELGKTLNKNRAEVITYLIDNHENGDELAAPKVTVSKSTDSISSLKCLLAAATSKNITEALTPRATKVVVDEGFSPVPNITVNVPLPTFTKLEYVRDFTGHALVSETDEQKRYALALDHTFGTTELVKLQAQLTHAWSFVDRARWEEEILRKERDEAIAQRSELIELLSFYTTKEVTPAPAVVDQQQVKEVIEKLQNILKKSQEEAAEAIEKQQSEIDTLRAENETLKFQLTNIECEVEATEVRNEVLEGTLAQSKAQSNVLAKLAKAFANQVVELSETIKADLEESYLCAEYIENEDKEKNELLSEISVLTQAYQDQTVELNELNLQKAALEKTLLLSAKAPVAPVTAAPFDIEALTAILDSRYVLRSESQPINSTELKPTYHPLEALSDGTCEASAEYTAIALLEPNEVETTSISLAEYEVLEGVQVQDEPTPKPTVEIEPAQVTTTVTQPKLTVNSSEFDLILASGMDYETIEKSINKMLGCELAPECDREAILQRLADLKAPTVVASPSTGVDPDAELKAEINEILAREDGSVIYKSKIAAKKFKSYPDPNIALGYIQEAIKLAYPKLLASMCETALSEAKNILIKVATPEPSVDAEASKTKKNHNSRKRDEAYAQQILDSVIPKINEPGLSDAERETRISDSAWMIVDSTLPTSRNLPVDLKATSLVTLIQQSKPELGTEEILNQVVDNLKGTCDEIALADAILTAKEQIDASAKAEVIPDELWNNASKLFDSTTLEDNAKRFELLAGCIKEEQLDLPDEVILNKVSEFMSSKCASQSELDEGRARAANYLNEIAQVYSATADETPQPQKAPRKSSDSKINAALSRINEYIKEQWIPAGNRKHPSMNHLVEAASCSKATVNKLKAQWQAYCDELIAQAS